MVNLDSYLSIFDKHNVTGTTLSELTLDQLKEMRIEDAFHQKSILSCVDELCGRTTPPASPTPFYNTNTHLMSAAVEEPAANQEQEEGQGEESQEMKGDHKMTEHTFTTVQRCHLCNYLLWGLVRQGYQCGVCGLCCHRTCAVGSLPKCDSNMKDGHESHSFDTLSSNLFGVTLESLTEDDRPPSIVVFCANELERRGNATGVDLFEVYRKNCSSEEINQLKIAFCKGYQTETKGEVQLEEFDLACVASTLKKFLRELSSPVIPENLYYRFIDAAKLADDEQCRAALLELIEELPKSHRLVLDFIMSHFARVCTIQESFNRHEPTSRLSEVFCHLLLRPPWEKITDIANNTEYHMRVLENLLRLNTWSDLLPASAQAPVLPPRMSRSGRKDSIISRREVTPTGADSVSSSLTSGGSGDASQRLTEAEWYWGSVTREEVNEMLRDTPDGTYLVREASNKHEDNYTLTLRKGGANKLIKIFCKDGLYGFVEPLKFRSVVELITYYQTHSLYSYNKTLDITLKYPVTRYVKELESAVDVETVKTSMIECHRDFIIQSQKFDELSEKHDSVAQDLQLKNQAFEAFQETINMFQEHLKLLQKYSDNVAPQDTARVRDNSKIIQSKIDKIVMAKNGLEADIQREASKNRTLAANISSLKPELKRLLQLRDQRRKWLLDHGENQHQLDLLLESSNTLSQATSTSTLTAVPATPDSCCHNDDNSWLVSCKRDEAGNILAGKPEGTFLVRPSSEPKNYALSIVTHGGHVVHCKIEQKDSGFGFAAPYFNFPTLKSLVLHYRDHTMVEHNAALDITLRYPVYASSSSQDSPIVYQTPTATFRPARSLQSQSSELR